MHRLHFATTVGGELGLETEIVQAGAARDEIKLTSIEASDRSVMALIMALAKRRLQSRVPLGGKTAIVALRFSETNGGASQHRNRQDQ